MSKFMTDHMNRRWATDLEAYKTYATMYRNVVNPHVRGMVAKSIKRIRADWPTHHAVFDSIDKEVNK